MTYMLLLNCALKLVEEIILYYDARSKKHQIPNSLFLTASQKPLLTIRLHVKVAFQFISPLLSSSSKGTAVPLQAWSGPEGSRKLRFPDFMTTVQNGGKVVSLTHRSSLPPGNTPGTCIC